MHNLFSEYKTIYYTNSDKTDGLRFVFSLNPDANSNWPIWPKVTSKLTLSFRNIKFAPWYYSSTWFSCSPSKYWSEEQIFKVLFCAGFWSCSKTDHDFKSGCLYREFWTHYTSKYCSLDETKLPWLWFFLGYHGFDRDWPESPSSNRINIQNWVRRIWPQYWGQRWSNFQRDKGKTNQFDNKSESNQ